MPLGTIMKSLKSQVSKGKKVPKRSLPGKSKSSEQDVDVLKMVREINLENLELPINGHESPPPSGNEKIVKSSDKRKRRDDNETSPIPVPKRRRSLASAVGKLSSSKRSAKKAGGSKEFFPVNEMDTDSLSNSGGSFSPKKSEADYEESDLLVSRLNRSGGTSKQKGKTSGQVSRGHSIKKTDDHVMKVLFCALPYPFKSHSFVLAC